jgi:(2Fe-2S) ferredoxin
VNRRYRVVVCRGPECGDRRGSRAIYDAFRAEIDARGLRDTCELGWQSCFGRCTQGPNVLVREIVEGGVDVPRATALYNGVDVKNVSEVCAEHLERGVVVRRLILGLSIALCAASASACKGKTEYKDSPETLDKLKSMSDQLKSQDELITSLRKEAASATLNGGDGTGTGSDASTDPNEWVFTIEGDTVTLKSKPSGGGGGPPPSDAAQTKLAQDFTDQVQKSKGSIQKCYETALKKSTGLASRTVNLTVVAAFASSGKFKSVSFSPELPSIFSTCLHDVAARWAMPAASQAMRFGANVKLTPT